jgi:GntR family transcriptional regulator, rspAB operon transcriptional repressor
VAETAPVTVLAPRPGAALSLSDEAYFRIRDLIVSLELEPGAIVNERELMQLLGLGRTPVREALRALAQEKLVEVYPRRGIFVSSVNVRDLASLSEVRAVLESHAAALAATRATPDERGEAAELIEQLEQAAGERDERRLIELDQRIHRHVYRCAHNPFLEETLNRYYVLTLRIWFLALDRVARLDEAVHEHRQLMEAIRAADPERAREAMRRHVLGFEQAIRQVL